MTTTDDPEAVLAEAPGTAQPRRRLRGAEQVCEDAVARDGGAPTAAPVLRPHTAQYSLPRWTTPTRSTIAASTPEMVFALSSGMRPSKGSPYTSSASAEPRSQACRQCSRRSWPAGLSDQGRDPCSFGAHSR